MVPRRRSQVRTPRIVVAAVLAALLAAGCTRGDQWRTYNGSCATGTSNRSAVLGVDSTSGEVVWRRSLAHPREHLPVASRGRVLLRGCGTRVLDLATGRGLTRTADELGVLGVAGDRLVTVTPDGDVRARPWAGGGGFVGGSTPKWKHVALVGHLVLAREPSYLVAMDVVRGAERWRTTLPTSGDTDELLVGDVLVLRAEDGSVYRLDAGTGAVAWRALPRGSELGYGRLLAAGPGTAVVAIGNPAAEPSNPATLVGLDLATGAERWRRDLPIAPLAVAPRAVDGTVVLAIAPGVLGLDLATGRDRWQVATESAAPVATASAVVVDDAASAFALDPVTGRVLWRHATGHRPLLGADPASDLVVLLDSPLVSHGGNDCC